MSNKPRKYEEPSAYSWSHHRNISPIEIRGKYLNSTVRFYFFLPSPLSSAAYPNAL